MHKVYIRSLGNGVFEFNTVVEVYDLADYCQVGN